MENKFIAFQTVDREGDIWCNHALLFKSEEDVEKFFKNPLEVLNELEHSLDEENNETVEDINYQIHRVPSGNNLINSITYTCDYAGDVKIVRMSKGHLIN